MGQAKSNRMSTGFTMADDIPNIYLTATVEAEVVPSQAWLDANPEVDGKRPECPAPQAEVRFVLAAHALFPKRTVPPPKWAKASAPQGEIMREPLALVLARMQKNHPEIDDDVRTVMAPAEETTE